jgi:hypothetical protein
MYCKHCGREIDDNSSFCKFCGKPQDNSNKSLINKPVWIIYLIWAIANLYLLMGEKYEGYLSDYFFPSIFSDGDVPWNKSYYDFSEFLFYVFILPSVLYVVYKRYHIKIDKMINRLLKN